MAKGSNYERTMAKRWSKWFSNGRRDDIFWRTDTSGGRATIYRKKKKAIVWSLFGDMTFRDSVGEVLIKEYLFEFKKGYNRKVKGKKKTMIGVLEMVDYTKKKVDPLLVEWWDKAEVDREAGKRKTTFVVFRRDSKEDAIMMRQSYFLFLCRKFEYFLGPQVLFNHNDRHLIILNLEQFFGWITAKRFKQLVGKAKKKIRRRK